MSCSNIMAHNNLRKSLLKNQNPLFFTRTKWTTYSHLKFLSKKLPKSFSLSHSNSHYFCRTFHSLCKPNNKNTHFLSPIHQWRSSSSSSSLTNSGFLLSNHAISRYYVSSAHFKKSFLGYGFRFLTNCSKFKFLPTQKKSSLGLGW